MTTRWWSTALFLGAGLGYAFSANAGFKVVALGVNGGVEEGNLTSYLIRSDSQTRYLALDAGSVLPGISKALAKGSFPEVTAQNSAPFTPQGAVFRQLISAYFISHGHLDHLAGLIVASPQDSKKPIYGTNDTIDILRQHYFNWRVWPNFSDSGSGQRIGTYRLTALRPGQRASLGTSGLSGVVMNWRANSRKPLPSLAIPVPISRRSRAISALSGACWGRRLNSIASRG
jgi:3',5'-cyclic-nucleotide phosphodiesterase